jgi:hypothetical protein
MKAMDPWSLVDAGENAAPIESQEHKNSRAGTPANWESSGIKGLLHALWNC